MANILVASKEEGLVELISSWMEESKQQVTAVSTLPDALAKIKDEKYDVVIVDHSVLDLTERYQIVRNYFQSASTPKLILMGDNFLDYNYVKEKIREGAWDCIRIPEKLKGHFIPFTVDLVKDRLVSSIQSALKDQSKQILLGNFRRETIIGNSIALLSSLADLAQATTSDEPILITGETGTGKELFARAAHENSNRRAGRFVPFNCASIPEALAESILFGYRRGAHSTATRDQDGLVTQAHNGTLFLDEIGELSPSNQARLLRCLQEKKVQPVGAHEEEDADFRLVSATNEDINEMRTGGKFRHDLYYRISTFLIDIPPLRKRGGDIQDIVEHYIRETCSNKSIPVKTWTISFMDALRMYDWPGNVRELINELNVAISRCADDPSLDIHHLSVHMRAEWIAKSSSRGFDLDEETRMAILEESLHVGTVALDKELEKEKSEKVREENSPEDPLTVFVKFIPGVTPALNECTEKLRKEYITQLAHAVRSKKVTVEQACKIAGIDKSSYFRLKKDYGIS